MITKLNLFYILIWFYSFNFLNVNAIQIIELNTYNSQFNDTVRDTQIIGIKKQPRSIKNIWSSAHIEIQSENTFELNEGVNITEIEAKKGSFVSILNSVVSKLKSFQESKNESYEGYVYVPIFKDYYIQIDTNGHLNVKYKFTKVDIRLIVLCIVGFLLYYFADRISRNEAFYYASGVTIGLVGSAMILLFIIMRFIPKKTTAFITFLTGSSLFLFSIRWLYFNLKQLTESLQIYVISYFLISGLISAIYCYYRGPVKNQRALKIIEFILKFLSLAFIYCGISYRELSISIILAFFLVNISNKIKCLTIFKRLSYKLFPPKRRLLTQEEYIKEGQDFTLKSLRELKEYCRSPECNSWKIISKIKTPERFARFIEDEENHINNEELNEYEKYSLNDSLNDEDLIDEDL